MRRSFKVVIFLLLIISANAFCFMADDALVMHLDASSLRSDYTNGQSISLWPDLAGSGNNAVQSQTSNQPVFIESVAGFNGCSVVRFDGDNDWLNLSSTMIDVHSFTIFAVARHDRANVEQYIVAAQDGSGDDRARMGTDNSGHFVWRAGNSTFGAVTSQSDTSVHLFACTSEVEGYLDGAHVNQ